MFCCDWVFFKLHIFHLHFGISHLKTYPSRTKVGNFNSMLSGFKKDEAQSWRAQMICLIYRQFHPAGYFTKENTWYQLYIVHALFILPCSLTDCMELSQLCWGQESSQLHNELGPSHILAQTLFTSPSFFSYWNQHFLSCSSLKSTSTRPDCLMWPLKPLENPWQLQMLYKAKKWGQLFTTSREVKKSREDAVTNCLAFVSIWLRGPCLAKLIRISHMPLRLS